MVATHCQRVGSAILYGVASFLIVIINKSVLTIYKFPSFQVLGLGQMIASIIILERDTFFHLSASKFDINSNQLNYSIEHDILISGKEIMIHKGCRQGARRHHIPQA